MGFLPMVASLLRENPAMRLLLMICVLAEQSGLLVKAYMSIESDSVRHRSA